MGPRVTSRTCARLAGSLLAGIASRIAREGPRYPSQNPHMVNTVSADRTLWTLAVLTAVFHALVGYSQHRLAWTGDVGVGGALYYAATGALLVCYAGLVYHVRPEPDRRALRLLIAVPLLIQVAWLASLPVLAIDAYSYLVDAARIQSGLNPYEHAVRTAGQTPLGSELAAYRWRPVHGISPYGPVWMHALRVIGPLTSNVFTAVLAVKMLAFGAIAAAAWLLYRCAPEAVRSRALVLFWWNPAVIIEGAGEGHNDAVMVALVLASIWWLRHRAPVAAATALTAAVLTKWIPLFFAPVFLAYAWRERMLTPRAAVIGALAVAGVFAAAYWPFWIGLATFAGIFSVGNRFVASTAAALTDVLPDRRVITLIVRAAAGLVTIAAVLRASIEAHSYETLLRGCAVIAALYVLVSSPLYWAWYVMLPVALLAVAGDAPLVLMITVGSRLVAPLDVIRLTGAFRWSTEVWLTTVIGLWVPLAFIIWRALRPVRAQGNYNRVDSIRLSLTKRVRG